MLADQRDPATPEPKEWGFLFKDPLALAVHNGTKTETRRLPGPRLFSVDGGPWPKGWTFDLAGARLDNGPSPAGNPGPYLVAKRIGADTVHRLYPRIQVGHRVWAKETWAPTGDGTVCFRADCPIEDGIRRSGHDPSRHPAHRWRSSILMPRHVARSVREVVFVGLERLSALTEKGALAEGVTRLGTVERGGARVGGLYGIKGLTDTDWRDPRDAFRQAWDSINGDDPDACCAADPLVLRVGWRPPAESSGRAASPPSPKKHPFRSGPGFDGRCRVPDCGGFAQEHQPRPSAETGELAPGERAAYERVTAGLFQAQPTPTGNGTPPAGDRRPGAAPGARPPEVRDGSPGRERAKPLRDALEEAYDQVMYLRQFEEDLPKLLAQARHDALEEALQLIEVQLVAEEPADTLLPQAATLINGALRRVYAGLRGLQGKPPAAQGGGR